ncbi:PDZ domain-containing protein [Leucobacter allii]|uniref:PDZ domain-containing protein n=1 Tax=Leucobacter allii TaxID=2932247 RepID=A0ABY4FKG5_9MICO|nr:PDZ domain-containing protein [Leucobacter allii]UOQ55811.1 PDZ domain-containing protein [Leucobacter allii]
MYDERRERRRSRILLGVAIAACLVLLAALIPSPYAIERPGPVVDTLGDVEIDGERVPVITVEDRETYATSGVLNLLTVSILGSPEDPQSWLSLLPALLDPAQRIAPVTEFYPEGVTVEQREAATTVQMDSSQAQAAAAAFGALGEEVGTELAVGAVAEGSPADGVLEVGDVIVSVDGAAVPDFAALRERIVAAGAGQAVRLGIERHGEPRELPLVPETPEGEAEPIIGASIATVYALPAEVDISLSQIGGPSAGMIFAIGIVDELTPGELLQGLTVSGTGTIAGTGEIGAIGGLEQKMWAASGAGSDLFLMPLANCADVPDRTPSGLRIAPVADLDEALAAIGTVADGAEPAGLERCDTGS